MTTVFITGGNGFVGRHLVVALLGRGDAVRVLALEGEDTSWLESRNVTVFRGDICRPETLVDPMRGADGVVHLAAMMDVWRPLGDYRAVNVTGTTNVCRAAISAGARRVVHMSSSSVYGMAHGRPVDETFPLTPFADPYPISKAEADVAVQNMIAEERLPAVIIRPDQIFGPGDHLHFGHMAQRAQSGKSIIIGSGRNRLPFVFVSDIVVALLLALDHQDALGRAYNITNDDPLTQRQLLEAIASDVGGHAPVIKIPYHAAYLAGYIAEEVTSRLHSARRPPITRLGVTFFGTDNRYSIGRARRELSFVPRVALRDGIRLTASWLQSQARPAEPIAHEEGQRLGEEVAP